MPIRSSRSGNSEAQPTLCPRYSNVIRSSLQQIIGISVADRVELAGRGARQFPETTSFAFEYNDARRAESGGASAARARVSPLATGEITSSGTQTPPQLPHHKVKIKKAGQRACNEKNEKGKFCGGHLKRWFYYRGCGRASLRRRGKGLGAGCRGLPLRALPDFVSAESRGSQSQCCGTGDDFGVRADAAAEGREEIDSSTEYLVASETSTHRFPVARSHRLEAGVFP